MPAKVLMSRGFARSARKLGLTDRTLSIAVREIEAGLVDARVGGFLLKKRIGNDGRGKRGGLRTIVAHRQADRLVFLYVFGKNERDNITDRERLALSELGDEYMRLTIERLDGLVRRGVLLEVMNDEQTAGQ
jgi:hypothetical protein